MLHYVHFSPLQNSESTRSIHKLALRVKAASSVMTFLLFHGTFTKSHIKSKSKCQNMRSKCNFQGPKTSKLFRLSPLAHEQHD